MASRLANVERTTLPNGCHNEVRVERAILLNHIVLGCRFVCSAVNKAGLAKLIGLAVETNVGRLVLSTGSGVNGFTLDPSLGEFILHTYSP